MSSRRARGLEYSNQVAEMRKSRPQPKNYSVPGPSKTMPPEIRDARSELDDISSETRQSRLDEDKIKDDQKERIVDSSDFVMSKPTSKQMPASSTTVEKKLNSTELNSVYRQCWTISSTIVIHPEIYDQKSYFIPNFISYYEVIFSMENLLHGNESLKYISRQYFSLPVRLYYAVIAILVIYRSKEAAGTLTKAEGSWIRMFRRHYPEEGLPVAAPLIPILQNIASHKPDDAQFPYVYPTLPVKGTYKSDPSTDNRPSTLTVDPSHYLIPSVTMLGDLLKKFCSLKTISDANFDTEGNFVPFNPTVGGEFAGVIFPPIGDGYTHAFASMLLNPAFARPLPEGKAHLKEIHHTWNRSRAKNFPSPTAVNGYDPTSPDDFMHSSVDLEWFGACRDLATKQVKFFAQSRNLSSISTLGDQAVVAQVHLKLSEKTKALQILLPHWYPDPYSGVKALFRSTSAEVNADSTMQIGYCLTNASTSWVNHEGNPIGSTESGMRSGPFWDNKKYNFVTPYPQIVLRGIETMIQSSFYNAYGEENSPF